MAEIITRDSEEFKELTGWIRRAGKAVEEATARMRPTIADEHYMTGMMCVPYCTFQGGHCKR